MFLLIGNREFCWTIILAITYFSSMLSFSFWSASEEIPFPWFPWSDRTASVHKQTSMYAQWISPETHVKRSGAELHVPLNDEAHRFLHVSFGDGQSTASLWQTALWKHLQQVLFLGLPLRLWQLNAYTFIVLAAVPNIYREMYKPIACTKVPTFAVAPSVLRHWDSCPGGGWLGRPGCLDEISSLLASGTLLSS